MLPKGDDSGFVQMVYEPALLMLIGLPLHHWLGVLYGEVLFMFGLANGLLALQAVLKNFHEVQDQVDRQIEAKMMGDAVERETAEQAPERSAADVSVVDPK